MDQLSKAIELDIDEISQALEKLVELSLIQVGGDLHERRYTIHRLTETFLLDEAMRWQRSI